MAPGCNHPSHLHGRGLGSAGIAPSTASRLLKSLAGKTDLSGLFYFVENIISKKEFVSHMVFPWGKLPQLWHLISDYILACMGNQAECRCTQVGGILESYK